MIDNYGLNFFKFKTQQPPQVQNFPKFHMHRKLSKCSGKSSKFKAIKIQFLKNKQQHIELT